MLVTSLNESHNLPPSNKFSGSSNELFQKREDRLNTATICNNRYEGKFVNANLSSRHLSKDKSSLLLKELKFVPTPKYITKAKIKEE